MLTETQTSALLNRQLSGFSVHSIPATVLNRAGEGVLLAVKRTLPYSISHWHVDSTNSTIWLTLKPRQPQQVLPLTLGVYYIPPESHRSPQLARRSAQARFDSKAASLSDATARGHVLLAGDFNARVGSSSQPWVSEIGPDIPAQLHNTDSTVNAHGRKLLQLCEDSAMVLCTGRTLSDTPAQPSFKARNNTQPSRLDHVMVDADLFQSVQSCGVDCFRVESDHLPLRLCLRLVAPDLPAAAPLAPTLLPTWKWDNSLRDAYACSLQTEHCQGLLADSMAHARASQHEQASSTLHASLDAAAKAAGLHRKQPCPKSPPNLAIYPWFGPRCEALRLQLRQAKRSLPRGPAVRLLQRQQ